MIPATHVPPLGEIAAALRKTTERLAREVAEPRAAPPDWTGLEWGVARAAVSMQGIAFLLATRLRWQGPPAWQSFLEEQRAQCLLRDAAIGRLIERLDEATRDARIACVALKGAALRKLGVYARGERPMADVDLLVRPTDRAAAAVMMTRLGYVGTALTGDEIAYRLPRSAPVKLCGEHADNPLKVEVHTSFSVPLPLRMVDITKQLYPKDARFGINAYPSLAALLLNNLLHAAKNIRSQALRQIQLHDIALLTHRMRAADWAELLDGNGMAEHRWWMYPPLALAARYYDCGTPSDVLARLRAACPPLLRRVGERKDLTDVSWSNLRIRAFPGLAWSRTAGDALRYARSRVLPKRDALLGLDVALEMQPQLKEVPWYQLSHGRRIARWLVSRPPRVQTLTSVIASLDHAPREGIV